MRSPFLWCKEGRFIAGAAAVSALLVLAQVATVHGQSLPRPSHGRQSARPE